MRCITYAGETVTTTDDVAAALVELTAALARAGQAEAVTIPIVLENGREDQTGDADLVIGLGNDVLSVPTPWTGDQPDFSEHAAGLRRHHLYPMTATARPADDSDPESDPPAPAYDWELGI